MKKTLVISYFNSLNETKICWGINSLNGFFDIFDEVILISNGDEEHTSEWIIRNIHLPVNTKYLWNKENTGVLVSLNQGYRSVSPDCDFIFFMHNDVAILDKLDTCIDSINNIISDDNTGVVGLFGARVATKNGGREFCVYNGLEAPFEGEKNNITTEVVLLDGLFLGVRKKILDTANGWDMNYALHHFYDKDISLESIKQGYKNYCIPIKYYHLSGKTAASSHYQRWISERFKGGDSESHNLSQEYYLSKWKDILPIDIYSNLL